MPTPEEIAARAQEIKNQQQEQIQPKRFGLPPLPQDKVEETKKVDAGDEGDFSLSSILKAEQPEKDEKPEKKEVKDTPKFNRERFKDFIEDEDIDEEKIVTKWSADREKLKKAELLAQGRTVIDNDEDIKSWNSWLKTDPETLTTATLAYEFEQDGLNKQEAAAKAKQRVEKMKAADPDSVEDYARNIKKQLKGSIAAKEQQYLADLEAAGKEFSFTKPTDELAKKTREKLLSKTDFLGMNLSRDESERMKLLEGADISHAEVDKMLRDPDTMSDVLLFLKYKKQWAKAIESRTNGKAKVLDKLQKTPVSGTTTRRVTPAATSGTAARPAISANSFKQQPVKR